MQIRKMGNTGKCTFVMQKEMLAVGIYCPHAYKAYVFKSNQLRSNFEAFAPGQSSKAQSPGSAHALNQRPMNEENIKMTNSEEGTV